MVFFCSSKVSLIWQSIKLNSLTVSNLLPKQTVLSWHTLPTHADRAAKFLAKSQRMHKTRRSLMCSISPQLLIKTLATGSVSPSPPPILMFATGMPLPPESLRNFERCRWKCHVIVAFLHQANIPSPRKKLPAAHSTLRSLLRMMKRVCTSFLTTES